MPDLDEEFPKLMEIHRNYEGADPENMLALIPEVLNKREPFYLESEPILQRLSNDSFELFKSKIMGLGGRNPLRGYQQFVDIFYELRGYEYLEEQGYSQIEFIEEDQNRKTPDLAAYGLGKLACLLEVKRIHISSDDEIAWKKTEEPNEFRLGSSKSGISTEFRNKIQSSVSEAKKQLSSYSHSHKVRKIVYLFISMDLDYTISQSISQSNWDELTSFLQNENGKDPEIEILWKYEDHGAPK